MAKTAHFFAGANSGGGFRNLFSELADPETMYDFMILKGGPGVGKSTFLRHLGQSMEEAGAQVEYLHCSGDPDSLDGVVIPEIRCAAADGTAPHVLEPRFPAAVDRYVNLGRFYDIAAAKTDAEAVKAHTRACQKAYRQAYSALNAARQVELEAVSSVTLDTARMERRFRGILLRELRRKGRQEGGTTRRFLGSVTHQGYVWRFDSVDALCPKVYELADSFGFAGAPLARLHSAAVSRGWDTIACVSPEEPERIEHLLIPGLGLAFVTSRAGMEYGGIPFRRVRLDALARTRKKGTLRFELRMAALLREEGIKALQEAKAAHDRLEAAYNPYVDFDGVHMLAALEAGRWLDYWQHRKY